MYPPLAEAMVDMGFQEVETYVSLLHNTAAQFIATRPIMDLCLAAERNPGSRLANRWWEQDGLDWEGMRMVYWRAERMEGEEEMDGAVTETG